MRRQNQKAYQVCATLVLVLVQAEPLVGSPLTVPTRLPIASEVIRLTQPTTQHLL